MKVIYINEAVFGTYKNKGQQQSKEDRLANVKRETANTIIAANMKTVVNEVPEKIIKLFNTILDASNLTFMIGARDFIRAEIAQNKIMILFNAMNFAATGYSRRSTGAYTTPFTRPSGPAVPTGIKVNVYFPTFRRSVIALRCLCKKLEEIYSEEKIKFDYALVLSEEFNDVEITEIYFNFEDLNKKFAESLIKSQDDEFDIIDVYNNEIQDANFDDVEIEAYSKTITSSGAKLSNLLSRANLYINNVSNLAKNNNLMVPKAIVKILDKLPEVVHFRLNDNEFENLTKIDVYTFIEKLFGFSTQNFFDASDEASIKFTTLSFLEKYIPVSNLLNITEDLKEHVTNYPVVPTFTPSYPYNYDKYMEFSEMTDEEEVQNFFKDKKITYMLMCKTHASVLKNDNKYLSDDKYNNSQTVINVIYYAEI